MNYNLKNFNPSEIMERIKNKMPFYNENHFRFEFAMAIKEYLNEQNAENIEIVFEVYYPTNNSANNEDSSIKRNYTDIVIYDEKGDYIAIELKYNLRLKNGKKCNRYYYNNGKYNISIAMKGATDNCRYDFLYDVYRLEQLKLGGKFENTNIKSFLKGYSIIISNDEKIWKISCPDKANELKGLLISKNNDKNFCIGDKSLTMENCSWTGGINYNNPKAKRKDFILKKSYKCNWNEEFYFEDKKLNNPSPGFRYLIIEV